MLPHLWERDAAAFSFSLFIFTFSLNLALALYVLLEEEMLTVPYHIGEL